MCEDKLPDELNTIHPLADLNKVLGVFVKSSVFIQCHTEMFLFL